MGLINIFHYIYRWTIRRKQKNKLLLSPVFADELFKLNDESHIENESGTVHSTYLSQWLICELQMRISRRRSSYILLCNINLSHANCKENYQTIEPCIRLLVPRCCWVRPGNKNSRGFAQAYSKLHNVPQGRILPLVWHERGNDQHASSRTKYTDHRSAANMRMSRTRAVIVWKCLCGVPAPLNWVRRMKHFPSTVYRREIFALYRSMWMSVSSWIAWRPSGGGCMIRKFVSAIRSTSAFTPICTWRET